MNQLHQSADEKVLGTLFSLAASNPLINKTPQVLINSPLFIKNPDVVYQHCLVLSVFNQSKKRWSLIIENANVEILEYFYLSSEEKVEMINE
jgi:hypothetical protein